MPKTLVTGANGFVAASIIDALILQYGHTVTGSVRTLSKGEQIIATHPEYAGKLDFVVVSDYAKEGTWDKTFQEGNFDYVIHTAAPLLDNLENTDFVKHYLEPSVHGATELLKSAKAYGKSVKAIVVTGSCNAMTTGMDVDSRVFSSDSWLPVTIDDAIKAQHPYISYCVAKAESEKAIWKFVKEEKPVFSVTNLLPCLIFGPPLQPVQSLKKINYSNDVFYSLFNGTYEVTPDTSFPSYIDVRDLATAHILSLTTPAVFNQRLAVGGAQYSSQLAVDSLKKVPEVASRLPKDGSEVPKKFVITDVEKWNEALGLKLRTAEETFGDAARKILELEKILGGK
ncbi:NAD(P)-binding Rossmann-fold containing protein [Glarea lozoyensis ATCC 20868]|uniref:NAD(P)-binding Rossmann-fold containing protein n=1 Tax=Glarea lozoyensis (strain ATCC 20868 / MF5171) TaxID=1116229 RepID=S3D1K8_GLAL2|nr:NAD(P)-binding Rossmann-fold containing protein [Glarea lozoyensis ATCC 20868]EPE32427.1 NAD(P)-binding Rossmann-fold containing protein [Glarea lozoyensis ATCC 20868]